jgi:transcriptional regulator PpsR
VSAFPKNPPDLAGLSAWAPQLAEAFVSLASDIALVLNHEGVVCSVVQGGTDPIVPAAQSWIGRPLMDAVTGDTRVKVQLLLAEALDTGLARRRQLNHPGGRPGADIPVAYTALRLGAGGPLLVVGRDLRSVASIQQRFLDAQQEMERGYWQARQAEARYRTLFQVATDAVMVVDAQTLKVLEANQAASQMFDLSIEQLVGHVAHQGFERHSRGAVEDLLNTARSTGQPAEIRAHVIGRVTPTQVAATPFRSDAAIRLLVRVRTADAPSLPSELNSTLARLVDGASDGVVVTDSSGRILLANPAFLDLVRQASEAEVKGRSLIDWIAPTGVPMESLLPRVRRQGVARRLQSELRLADGSATVVEISATLLAEGDQERIGFTVHPVRPRGEPAAGAVLAATIDGLHAQLGQLPLPALLREATAAAERHFLDLALTRSGGDLGVAASALGISVDGLRQRRRRQSNRTTERPQAKAPPDDTR